MSKIVTTRHGCYCCDTGRLDRADAAKAERLGKAITLAINIKNFDLFASPVMRAAQTAERIGATLGRKPVLSSLLDERCTNPFALVQLIENHALNNTDLVLVMHLPQIKMLVSYFNSEYCSDGRPIMNDEIKPCQAMCFDTITRLGELISVD